MNKKHFLVLLIAAVLLLSACTPQGGSVQPSAVSSAENSGNDTTENRSSNTKIDLLRDISLFDDNAETIEALLGTPDEVKTYSSITDLHYEHYSYLGKDVQLDFKIDDDFENSSLVISYYYVREYEYSGPDDVYKPSAEELRIAQDFKNELIELLTSWYGDPVWESDDGIEFGWEKEQRMDHTECIKLEHGYSKTAFDLYLWID
ncbi:MAG: hypothetical protein PUD44_06135 [Clostridiaceae bacterium]|nr:hypothetical protein [Clostridiaceae bacterium]